MKEHHKAARYFIDFTTASTRTGWNDAALRHAAYKGLAKRIKDDLLHFPQFQSFTELRQFALECDSRYWERKDYDAMANARSPQTSNRSNNQLTNANQSSSGSNKDKNCNKGTIATRKVWLTMGPLSVTLPTFPQSSERTVS
jgi:hypothetical protein